jgi:hypothetical protein
MPRRRRSSFYDSYSERPTVKHGLLHALMPLIVVVAVALLVFVVISIVLNFDVFLVILQYALFVAIGLGALVLLYVVVRIGSSISSLLSQASIEHAVARQEKERARQTKMQVEMQRARLARQVSITPNALGDEYQVPRRKLPSSPKGEEAQDDEYQQIPYRTKKLPPSQEALQDDPPAIPGMPEKGQTFRYCDYQRLVRPGELILGVRRDGTARIGTWQDYKVLLILGSSSSGKSNTIAEKCTGAAAWGAQLVLCDPHGYKEDSLLKRVYPLQPALLPGTTLAFKHEDIMFNVRAVREELQKRVDGGACSPAIVLVVEELNRLQRDKAIANELKLILQEIGQEGRGFEVYAIVGAQLITHLAAIRKSFISTICHRVDESEAKLVIPARYAKYTSELGTGQTYVKDADGLTEPLQQTLITVEDIVSIAARLAPQQTSKRGEARTTRTLQTRPLGSQTKPAPVQRRAWRAEEATTLSHGEKTKVPEQSQAPTVQSKLDRLSKQREHKK